MLTVTQAAALADVGAARIRKLMQQGRIKGEKLTARMWLVDEASLREWIATPRKAGNPNIKTLRTQTLEAKQDDK